MSSFTDQYIDDTFKGILHVGGIPLQTSRLINVFDGDGNQSSLSLGRDGNGVNVSGALSASGILTSGNVTYPTSSTGVNLLDLIYPVGSVYFSTVFYQNFNIFGGTWEQTAQGRFMVGVGEGTGKNGIKKTFNSGNNNNNSYQQEISISHKHGVGKFQGNNDDHLFILEDWNNGETYKMGRTTGEDPYGEATNQTGTPRGTVTSSNLSNNTITVENTPPSFGLYVYTRTA